MPCARRWSVNEARVVVIDSLNGYLNAMPHNNYLTAQLHELLSYLQCRGSDVLVVAQSGMMGSNMTSPVDASYLADCVVMLRYFEHAGRIKKAISVLKKRTGAHEESIREMWFDSRGIHLSEPLLGLRGVLTGVPTGVKSSRALAAKRASLRLMFPEAGASTTTAFSSCRPRGGTARPRAALFDARESSAGVPRRSQRTHRDDRRRVWELSCSPTRSPVCRRLSHL